MQFKFRIADKEHTSKIFSIILRKITLTSTISLVFFFDLDFVGAGAGAGASSDMSDLKQTEI